MRVSDVALVRIGLVLKLNCGNCVAVIVRYRQHQCRYNITLKDSMSVHNLFLLSAPVAQFIHYYSEKLDIFYSAWSSDSDNCIILTGLCMWHDGNPMWQQ